MTKIWVGVDVGKSSHHVVAVAVDNPLEASQGRAVPSSLAVATGAAVRADNHPRIPRGCGRGEWR